MEAYLNIAVKAWNYSIYREANISSDRGNELVKVLNNNIDSEKLLDNIYKEKIKIAKWDSRLVVNFNEIKE